MNKIKWIFFALTIVIIKHVEVKAQSDTVKLYNPKADVVNEYAAALMKANMEGRQVLLHIGGNWCKWCLRFDKFCKSNKQVDSLLKADYVVLHINYSKENKNLPFLETLNYPQRFGFPVFVIVNANAERLHTQSSWFLEDGKESYDAEKVIAFLKGWNLNALNPKNYEEK
ncbi:MAG: thioredoxin family protein [Bacteroidia bacterium]